MTPAEEQAIPEIMWMYLSPEKRLAPGMGASYDPVGMKAFPGYKIVRVEVRLAKKRRNTHEQ